MRTLLGALQLVRTLYELHFKCHYAGGGSRKDKKCLLCTIQKGDSAKIVLSLTQSESVATTFLGLITQSDLLTLKWAEDGQTRHAH